MVINATSDGQTLSSIDKTWDEITSFVIDGGSVRMRLDVNNPYAPYAEAYFLKLCHMELDVSFIRRLEFINVWAEIQSNNSVMLNIANVIVVPDGSGEVIYANKAIN